MLVCSVLCLKSFGFFLSFPPVALLHALFSLDWSMDYWKINVLVVIEVKKKQQQQKAQYRESVNKSEEITSWGRQRGNNHFDEFQMCTRFHSFDWSFAKTMCTIFDFNRIDLPQLITAFIHAQHMWLTHFTVYRQIDNWIILNKQFWKLKRPKVNMSPYRR